MRKIFTQSFVMWLYVIVAGISLGCVGKYPVWPVDIICWASFLMAFDRADYTRKERNEEIKNALKDRVVISAVVGESISKAINF